MMTQQRIEEKNWFKKHADAVAVIGAIVVSICWMNHNINNLQDKMNEKFNDLDRRLVRIETVMIMNKIMPEAFSADGGK